MLYLASLINIIVNVLFLHQFLEKGYGRIWRSQTYPNPFNCKIGGCKRDINISWICDPDSILSQENSDKLEKRLEEIHHSTSAPCKSKHDGVAVAKSKDDGHGYRVAVTKYKGDGHGYRVAVAIAQQIYNENKNVDTQISNFSNIIRTKSWMLPVKPVQSNQSNLCDDSVMMLLSKNDRAVYISVGAHAKLKLSDCALMEIINIMRPYLSDNNIGLGLAVGADQICGYLNGQKVCTSSNNNLRMQSAPSAIISICFIASVLVLAFSICYRLKKTPCA